MNKPETIHYIYVIAAIDRDLPVSPCKIGITSNLPSRMSSLQTGNPKKLEIIAALPIPDRRVVELVENALHEIFDEFRLVGEWFDTSPVDAVIGACTIVHEIFCKVGATDEQITKALHNLGITQQITAAFHFIDHCKAKGLPLQTRLMQ